MRKMLDQLPLSWWTGVFVVVWCTGYVSGPVAIEAAGPFTALMWRFGLATVVAAAFAWVMSGWPRHWQGAAQALVVGLALNGAQFSLMYVALDVGLDPTVGALFHSLSPVLTLLVAARLFGEAVSGWQVFGFGLGVLGVAVVLGPDLGLAGGTLGLVLAVLATLSLCAGWLGQRVSDPAASIPVAWHVTLQFAAALPIAVPGALLLENKGQVFDGVAFGGAVLYLAVINSLVGVLLIQLLVRRGGAGATSSVFFLMPPVTALMTFAWFGTQLGWRELIGLALSAGGVALATRAAQRVDSAASEV